MERVSVQYSNTGMVSGRSFATKNYTSQIFHTMYSTVYYVRLRTVWYSTSYETKIISHSDNYSDHYDFCTVRWYFEFSTRIRTFGTFIGRN